MASQLGGHGSHSGVVRRTHSRIVDWVLAFSMLITGVVLEFVPQGGRVVHPVGLVKGPQGWLSSATALVLHQPQHT